jgi:hypothetical protein
MGLSSALIGAAPARSIYIDKIFLATNDGLWSACADDSALPKKQPDIAPTASTQGSVNMFGPGSGVIRIPIGSGIPRQFTQ